jgi:RNA polymerase sigma-70 factor (sigma-E family)
VSEYVVQRGTQLVRAATLLTGDRFAAEDLCQETLARMLVAWPRIRDQDAAHAYALTTMTRLYHRQQRRRWHGELPSARLPERVAADRDGTVGLAIELALAQLPPGQRAAVVLRYYADLSVSQTARALHCSEGNVKSQCSRGLARLAALLSDAEQIGSES